MKIPNLDAIKDWLLSKIINNMMVTEPGFFMDARQGPVIQGEIDEVKNGLSEVTSKLASQNVDISVNTTYFDIVSKNCAKYGNVVQIYLWLAIKRVPSSALTIATSIPKAKSSFNALCAITDGYGIPLSIASFALGSVLEMNVGQITKLETNKYLAISTTYIAE